MVLTRLARKNRRCVPLRAPRGERFGWKLEGIANVRMHLLLKKYMKCGNASRRGKHSGRVERQRKRTAFFEGQKI